MRRTFVKEPIWMEKNLTDLPPDNLDGLQRITESAFEDPQERKRARLGRTRSSVEGVVGSKARALMSMLYMR